jgi:hypothetical protein
LRARCGFGCSMRFYLAALRKRGNTFILAARTNRTALEMVFALPPVAHRKRGRAKKNAKNTTDFSNYPHIASACRAKRYLWHKYVHYAAGWPDAPEALEA